MRKELKKLKNRADKLWRTVGKEGKKCEICTSLNCYFKCSSLQPHHYVLKGHKSLCWDLRNRVWLCPSHHTLGDLSAHRSQEWFRLWFKAARPADYKYCDGLKNKLCLSIDYEKIIAELERMI